MPRVRKVLILLLLLIPASAIAVTAGVEDAKSIARLYSAAFDRKPDIGGLNYWIGVYEAGESLPAIAGGFYSSPEFTNRYGTLSDQQYVEQLYQNVLGRAGEAEGVSFWTNHLSNGVSRAEILAEFAASPENIAKTADMFADLRLMNCQWSFGPEPPAVVNTGLLAGSAVSGVAYETPTHRGVTGPEGGFQYEACETVRFMIGGTLLGEVKGQRQVTPFDLAGSVVATGGPDITAALGNKEDPFQAVVNIVTFLQSLDQDGNPDNGIEINPEVAALFADVNLDVRQDWRTFRNQYNLRYALEQANEQRLFSETHGVANPATALQQLYRALKIDDRLFLISRWESNSYPSDIRWRYDANGYLVDSEWLYTSTVGYEYSNDGTLTRVASPTSYSEDDEGFGRVKRFRYEYDLAGNLTLLETQKYWKFEDKGIQEITSKSTETWRYDTRGNLTRYEIDEGTDGVPDYIEKWEFNTNGELTRHEQGEYTGHEIPAIWEERYDDEGRLAEVKYNTWTATYQYDVQGRPVLIELNGEGLSTAAERLNISTMRYLSLAETYRVTYEYGAEGNLTQEILDGFSSNYGREIVTHTYDLRGNVTREEDQIMPVRPTSDVELYSITLYGYEYNEFGNVIRQTTDEDGDGTLEKIENRQYQYDSSGNLTQYGTDFAVHKFHYEPTGWGHIFASPPPDDSISLLPRVWEWPSVSSPLDWNVY